MAHGKGTSHDPAWAGIEAIAHGLEQRRSPPSRALDGCALRLDDASFVTRITLVAGGGGGIVDVGALALV